MNTLFPNFRTMADPNACQLYAMDRYGNLFVDYDNGAYGSLVLNAIQSLQRRQSIFGVIPTTLLFARGGR